jgi:hypothetical protein
MIETTRRGFFAAALGAIAGLVGTKIATKPAYNPAKQTTWGVPNIQYAVLFPKQADAIDEWMRLRGDFRLHRGEIVKWLEPVETIRVVHPSGQSWPCEPVVLMRGRA